MKIARIIPRQLILATTFGTATLLAVSSGYSQVLMSSEQWQEEAEIACEAALASGDLAALEAVAEKYYNVPTACTAMASTAAPVTGFSDSAQNGDGIEAGDENGDENGDEDGNDNGDENGNGNGDENGNGQNPGNDSSVGSAPYGGVQGEEPSGKDGGN